MNYVINAINAKRFTIRKQLKVPLQILEAHNFERSL